MATSIEAAELSAMAIQCGNSHTNVSSHTGTHGDIHQVKNTAGTSDKVCYRCRKTGHKPDKCYFKEGDCYSCHVRGHTFRVCRNRK